MNGFVFGDRKIEDAKLSKFPWSDEYNLNVDKIDDDHKQIVRLINILIEEINIGKKPAMIKAFNDLINFSKQHFDEEEDYMRSFNYPQLDAHAKVHKRLISQLHDHRDSINRGEFNGSKVVLFIQNWLLSHIMGIDNDYVKYHNKNKSMTNKVA